MVTQLCRVIRPMRAAREGVRVDEPRACGRCLRHSECRIVVAKKLQKVHKNWKYSRRNRHNGRAARRVRAEQPWARNATG